MTLRSAYPQRRRRRFAPVALAGAAILVVIALLIGIPAVLAPSGAEAPAAIAETPSELAGAHIAAQLAQASEGTKTLASTKRELDQAVTAIEADGSSVSYIAVDLATGATVEYQADTPYYSASTIKAPFCVSLMRAEGASARSSYGGLIESCLANSDNTAYDTLRRAFYGPSFYPDFAREAGVTVDPAHWYTRYSVRQYAQLWIVSAQWLSSGDENAVWLGGILQDTLQSQVDDLAGANGTVTWSKAGWYAGDPEYNVTFDGGIVRAAGGDYAIAVATDRGSDFDAVRSVMKPLIAYWDVRNGMAG